MPIRVLIVDDSALIRKLLGELVKSDPGLQLVGAAPDAYAAKKLMQEQMPDVITLDIEMPKVDGLRFLEVMMRAQPTPTLMISTLTEAGAAPTLRALELGAVDFIAKPKLDVTEGIEEYRSVIINKIKVAAKATLRRPITSIHSSPVIKLSYSGTEKIVAIGASTGGTEAIKDVLCQLPSNFPAVVITQHMPPGFTSSFAKRLDGLSRLKVVEAQGGERLLPGHAYLAPGNMHLCVSRSGADYRICLDDGERVRGHKPSVDVMFNSLVECAGENVLACLLTGMGKDGAEGMKALHEVGAFTVCQSEETCVVFGMPKEAIKLGGVDAIEHLDDIASVLTKQLEKAQSRHRL